MYKKKLPIAETQKRFEAEFKVQMIQIVLKNSYNKITLNPILKEIRKQNTLVWNNLVLLRI